MLGKLLKHEFRATGRLMLPALGAVLILAALANFSIRFIQVTDSTFLTILFGLVILIFVIGIVAAAVPSVLPSSERRSTFTVTSLISLARCWSSSCFTK